MCKIIGRSQQVGIDKTNLNVVKAAFCSDCAGSRATRTLWKWRRTPWHAWPNPTARRASSSL